MRINCSGCVEGPNGLATAVLVDNSGNGAADTIYAGDYLGNMWRFEQDMSNGIWSLGNGGQPIFKALDPTGKPQSITSGVLYGRQSAWRHDGDFRHGSLSECR